jgi:DNA-binding FadR family transcriptional regulator
MAQPTPAKSPKSAAKVPRTARQNPAPDGPARKTPAVAAKRHRFEPVSAPPRAFEQVCVQIRRLLADGTIKPGDKLPAERELAENLRVSRGVVREALRTLEIAGLIELRKGGSGGAFVVSEQFRIVAQAFKDMVYMGTISLAELIEARQKFLADAIELACERGLEEDFDAIEANIDRTEEEYKNLKNAFSDTRRLQLAAEFYHLVGMASKNQVIVVALDTVSQMLLQFFRPRTNNRPTLQLVASRRRFLAHLRARNVGKASKEMSSYLAALQHYMLVLESIPEANPLRPAA